MTTWSRWGRGFDSIEWLERIWMLQATVMGLRCVAHVGQADSLSDPLTVNFDQGRTGDIEPHIFQQQAKAEEWLRSCQRQLARVQRPQPLKQKLVALRQQESTRNAPCASWRIEVTPARFVATPSR